MLDPHLQEGQKLLIEQILLDSLLQEVQKLSKMSVTTKHLCSGAKPVKVSLVFLLQLLPSLSAFVLEGSKTSYAQFPAWAGVMSSSDRVNRKLSFEFRTAKPSGLLLYSDTVTCEYLEIRLVGGELRARLDTGAVLAVTSGDDGLTSPQAVLERIIRTI